MLVHWCYRCAGRTHSNWCPEGDLPEAFLVKDTHLECYAVCDYEGNQGRKRGRKRMKAVSWKPWCVKENDPMAAQIYPSLVVPVTTKPQALQHEKTVYLHQRCSGRTSPKYFRNQVCRPKLEVAKIISRLTQIVTWLLLSLSNQAQLLSGRFWGHAIHICMFFTRGHVVGESSWWWLEML